MTTIAYDHKSKLIAVDGRMTAGNLIVSDDHKKFIIKDGVYWFLTGVTCDFDAFVNLKHGDKAPDNLDCLAIMVHLDDAYLCGISNGVFKVTQMHHSEAIGSGDYLAMAAMDFGKSAIDAVKYAAKRDCKTGGVITCFDISTGKITKVGK